MSRRVSTKVDTASDWRGLVKAKGITTAKLLRVAGAAAKREGWAVPRSIDLIAPELHDHLRSWLSALPDPESNAVLPNGNTETSTKVEVETSTLVEAPPVRPWPAKKVSELLADVDEFIGRFVAFPSPTAGLAVTLWAAHAHAIDAFDSSPRLALLSPEKGSGKTRCLEVLELLVPNPMHAVNCTAAALFRAVAAKQPTLLFDEADTYFGPRAKDHEELRGLLNAGHRRGAVAYRCVGEPAKMEVHAFAAFAAVALAGIGDLPDTILDRAVVVRMKRRAPNESVTPFRHRDAAAEGGQLAKRLERWAKGAREQLADARPAMPAGITDRPADVWEPLLAIADDAGDEWPQLARRAAVEINAARVAADPSLGVQLLRDIRNAYATAGADRFSSEDLVNYLVTLDDAPWGDLRGKPLDARGLARRLRRFDIKPNSVRIGDSTPKGYLREWLVDAWDRYLPSLPPEGATSATVADVAGVALSQGRKAGRPLAAAFPGLEEVDE